MIAHHMPHDLIQPATSAQPVEKSPHSSAALAVAEALKNERARIALELHDTVNAHNVALRLYAQGIALRAETIGEAELCSQANRLNDELTVMYHMARNVVDGLVHELDPSELLGALTQLASNINIGSTKCELKASADLCESLTNTQAMSIYRVAQEATSNALKHAKASKITIELVAATSPRCFQLTISDNGQGFDATKYIGPAKMGLKGMQRRASDAGGVLRLVSTEEGTVITLTLDAAI